MNTFMWSRLVVQTTFFMKLAGLRNFSLTGAY